MEARPSRTVKIDIVRPSPFASATWNKEQRNAFAALAAVDETWPGSTFKFTRHVSYRAGCSLFSQWALDQLLQKDRRLEPHVRFDLPTHGRMFVHAHESEEEKKVVWQGKGGNAAIQRRKNLENRQPRLLSDFRFRLYPAVRVRVRPPRPQEAKASE